MPKIYLCRHAETIANVEQWVSGWINLPLTEKGQEQAKLLAAELVKKEDIEGIVSSDLLRASSTAEELLKLKKYPYMMDHRLRERNYGHWTRRPIEEVRQSNPEAWDYWKADPDFIPPGGESLQHLQDRVVESINETCKKHKNAFVLFGHWGTIWVVMRHLYTGKMERWPTPAQPPEFLEVNWPS